MLRDPRIADFDILAIQEPWRNPFSATTHHPAKDCYPPDGTAGLPARECFFVNERLDHAAWQFASHGRDACTITMRDLDTHGGPARMIIHHINNPPRVFGERRGSIPTVSKLLEDHVMYDQIVLGDFNLHHSMWGGERVRQADREADELIQIMERFNMANTLRTGTITYEEGPSRSTIHLCWVSLGVVDSIIRCGVDKALDHDSDHLPISTVLDFRVNSVVRKPVRNWKHLDDAKYRKALAPLLPTLRRPRTKRAMDDYIEALTTAMQGAADQALPMTRPSTKAREGWTAECSTVMSEAKRLRRIHSARHTDETWEAYRLARNQKGRTIKKALKKAHREKVEKAAESPQALWRLTKWARTRINKPQASRQQIRTHEREQE